MLRRPAQASILKILRQVGALAQGHFIYSSGRHGDTYVNKDAIYRDPFLASYLCEIIADEFKKERIEAVLAPAIGGIDLKTWISYHLSRMNGRKIYGAYAEKTPDGNSFMFRRGYDQLIAARPVLMAEDVLSSGASAKKVVALARAHGAEVAGMGALFNRGGVTAEILGVPRLFSVVDLPLLSWIRAECPLCLRHEPFTQGLGHTQ